jgi:hypothetical protein
MRTNRKSVVNVAGAGALALVVATSAFAAPQRGNDRRADVYRGRTETRQPQNRGSYRNESIRGVVKRIDFRSGVLLLRDASTGRTIDVDMRDTARSNRVDFGDLRRGDYVTLSGQWRRGGAFEANRIQSVDSRRR